LGDIKTPLFSLLYKDGLAHCLLFIESKIFVICGILVPTIISAVTLPSTFPFLVVAVVVNRLFLRLRRAMLSQTPGLTNYTTTGFAVFKHGTDGDEDSGRGITTIRGSDKTGRRIRAQRHSHPDDELFSLPVGGGDIEMSLSKKDGELQPSDSTRCYSTIRPTSMTSGSSGKVDVSALDSKP